MGQQVQSGEIPWQAILIETRTNGQGYLCGGSLIQPTWVFTAAHCVANPGTTEVGLGGTTFDLSGHPYRQTADLRMAHENYNPNTLENDVGLLRLPVAASGPTIATIPLAQDNVGPLENMLLRVSGYGGTERGPTSPDLLKVQLMGISNAECAMTFGSTIMESTLCANWSTQEGQSICQGDSGGPLTLSAQDGSHILVGVVSFTGNSCDQGLPQGFARVTSFRSWVETNIAAN